MVHQHARADRFAPRCAGSTCRACGRWSAASSSRSGRGDAQWDEVRARLARAAGHRQFRAGDARRAGSRRDRRGRRRRPSRGRPTRQAFASRRGAPTSDFRSRRRRSSAKSAVACRRRPAGRSICPHPELTIRDRGPDGRRVFLSSSKEPGAGGLPVGTSGKVMCLLSGGIDSPVAAWRLIRRGCRAHFVHFHSYPILSRTSQDKARELVRAADAPPAAIAAVPRAVRPHPAAGRRRRAAAAARRRLPPADDADRRAARGHDRRARARDGRRRRPGRVADDRQSRGRRRA